MKSHPGYLLRDGSLRNSDRSPQPIVLPDVRFAALSVDADLLGRSPRSKGGILRHHLFPRELDPAIRIRSADPASSFRLPARARIAFQAFADYAGSGSLSATGQEA